MSDTAKPTDQEKSQHWRGLARRVTICYRIAECGDKIPMNLMGTPYEFVESDIDSLHTDGFLEIEELTEPLRKKLWAQLKDKASKVLKKTDMEVASELHWKLTQKGMDFLKSMAGVIDHCIKYEVFASVSLNEDISEIEDGEGGVHASAYDPRFADVEEDSEREEKGTVDLRLAILRFKTEEAPDTAAADPFMVVFLFNWVKEGELQGENIWFDLREGTIFREVEEMVESAYKWRDYNEDIELAKEAMRNIFTAGMVEEQKRCGTECSACETPLAMYDRTDDGRHKKISHCPMDDCKAELDPPPPEAQEFECPSCQSTVHSHQEKCPGCFANLNFSLPPGTIQNNVTTVEEVVEECYDPLWGSYGAYGYAPIPLYDPYDCMASSLLLGAAFADFGCYSHYPMYDNPFDPWDDPYHPFY